MLSHTRMGQYTHMGQNTIITIKLHSTQKQLQYTNRVYYKFHHRCINHPPVHQLSIWFHTLNRTNNTRTQQYTYRSGVNLLSAGAWTIFIDTILFSSPAKSINLFPKLCIIYLELPEVRAQPKG